MNSRRVKRIVNNRLIPVKEKLNAIERRLKRYLNCPFCGFNQGKPDPYFGTGLTPTFMKLMKGVDTGVKTATETMLEAKMKYMKRINKLQADLTDLRREVQRSEAPKAGECTCISGVLGDDCPRHPNVFARSTPDLPLHVRVAVIMGWEDVSCNGIDDWTGKAPKFLRKWSKIPDFPNDLVAAMGALEEYCEKHKIYWRIKAVEGGCYWIQFYQNIPAYPGEQYSNMPMYCCSLPQAICEAIVAHSEGK